MKRLILILNMVIFWLWPTAVDATGSLNITDLTISGFDISSMVRPNGFNINNFYEILIGYIRGGHPEPSNATRICGDILNSNHDGTTWIASKRDIVTYAPIYDNNGSATGHYNVSATHVGSQNNVNPDSPFRVNGDNFRLDNIPGSVRLYAILVETNSLQLFQQENTNWCNQAVYLTAKQFQVGNGTVIEQPGGDINGGGGGGGGGGGTMEFPDDLDFTGLTEGGGVSDASGVEGLFSVGNPADLNLINTYCEANFSLTLPDGRGEIKFANAGLLGFCSPRPLLLRLISVMLILAYIFFIIAIIYSGIILATADSDEKAIIAKKNLTWAAIGALIITAANWVVPAVINVITSST